MLDLNDLKFSEFVYKNMDRMLDLAAGDDKSLSKIILYVSTGAFGVSLTFFISRSESIIYPILVQISWLCLAISIWSNAQGYFLSKNETEKRIKILNKEISGSNLLTPQLYNKILDKFDESIETEKLNTLNHLCVSSFSLGLLFLLAFALVNV